MQRHLSRTLAAAPGDVNLSYHLSKIQSCVAERPPTFCQYPSRRAQSSSQQVTGIGEARQRTQTRGSTRNALRELLEAINAVARTMGVADRFSLSDRDNDGRLLQAARSFAANAAAMKADFIAHEMPGDFIDDLQASIGAFESDIAEHGNAIGDHVQAGVALDDAIDEGVEIVNKLDGIMRAKYASNRAVLAEWMSASHIEPAPHHNASAPPPPSTGGTSVGGPSTGGTPPTPNP